jgi:hypothetical protein
MKWGWADFQSVAGLCSTRESHYAITCSIMEAPDCYGPRSDSFRIGCKTSLGCRQLTYVTVSRLPHVIVSGQARDLRHSRRSRVSKRIIT